MTVLTAEEVKKRFGYTPEQLDKMEADATAGIFHGEPAVLLCMRRVMAPVGL